MNGSLANKNCQPILSEIHKTAIFSVVHNYFVALEYLELC